MTSNRAIGPIGTTVRILLGIGAFVSAFIPDRPYEWQVALGLVGMPAAFVIWQLLRARLAPRPAADACAGVVASVVLGAALLGFGPTRPAALLFAGLSLLVAGIRGYAGCEVTAIGNWLLRRDDRVGCVVLSPVDAVERQIRSERAGDQGFVR